MELQVNIMPKKGDYEAFRVDVWSDGKLQFLLIEKISGTELATSIAKECVSDKNEALEKLKIFSVAEAKRIYSSNGYKLGEKIVNFYSPCWNI